MGSEAFAKLEAALPGIVEERAGFDVDGVALDVTLLPRDTDDLTRSVRFLRESGLGAIVRGGGNRFDLGNVPTRASVLLSTERLDAIDEIDTDEGVCRARAGTQLSTLRAAARENGWELPLDAPGAGATVGGVLAAAAIGPRALGYRQPRDLVLGLDVVLGSGERTRCGGRVVKNVTGYDLAKLYVGSLGTLCVIDAAWLRLSPVPDRVVVLTAESANAATACESGVRAARCVSARACIVSLEADSAPHLIVELAGDSASVERDADALSRDRFSRAADATALDAVRSQQLSLPEASGLRIRIPSLPSQLAGCCDALLTAGSTVLAYPGLGFLLAGVELPTSAVSDSAVSAADTALAAASALAERSRGAYVVERAPLAAKRDRDVFGVRAAGVPLVRALKQRFDPDGVLAAGRFAGRI